MQMAAVDRRLGMIRRGTTPAAPKPINLPSQKLENQGLVPDVELVPRGTFVWGGAGRSTAASGKNNERPDSAPPDSASSKTADNGTDVENDVVSLGLDAGVIPSCAVESSTLATPVPAGITPVQTSSVSSSFEANDANLDKSPDASDTGSLSGSSIFESGTSPSVSPVTINNTWGNAAKVEEQKNRKGSPIVCEGSENVSNLESKQGTCGNNESLPGCQDFGYFEGFYSNNHTFFSPGMSYSNGQGMDFGAGLHPEPSQHDGFYSFLGVPYYDSTKDKEIVVITMVGNPGFHGNYLPHPSLPDQYGRPTVFGNFPLQFGHFDNMAVPGHGRNPMSAEMNSMCAGEQGEFACYEQGYYEDKWLNGSSIRDVQSGNGAFWPSSFPMCQNIPKRAGRQKPMYRNKRAAPKEALSAALKPERRVTLLTKVSQHEVIISSLQKTSKTVGNGLAGGFSAAPSFDENFMEAPLFDPQCETAIAESSNADRIHEIVDMEKSHVSDVSRSLSAQERIPLQATCTGSENVDSALLSSHDIPCLESKVEASVSESSSTTISTLTSHAQDDLVECHEDSPKKGRPTCEAECVSFNVNGYTINAAELPQDSSLHDSTESTTLIEQANEQVNREGALCTTTVVLLPHKHNEGLPNKKSDMKWKRKGAVAMAKLGQEHLNSKAQGAVVDKKASSLPSPNDKTIASADSLPNEPVITKAIPQCNAPLFSRVPDSLCASGGFAASKEKLDAAGSLNCAVLDSASKIKKGRKLQKAILGNVDLNSVTESRSVQKLESSNKLPFKTQPFAEGHNLNLEGAPCGMGKEWRPKLPRAGHGKSATKASNHQASKATMTPKVSKPEEVSCDDVCVEKFKQQQQDEGRDTLSCVVDRQEAAKMMSLTCTAPGKNFNNFAEKEQNIECLSDETLPLSKSRLEHRENDEKLIREQKSPKQEPLASKPEGSALGLWQQGSSVKKNQEQKQLPVEKAPQGHAGPGPIMENTQHSKLVARSVLSFGRPSVKQSPYVASWGGRKIGFPFDTSKFKRFNQNYGHPQEAQRNLIRQPRQKVWCCKVMRAQEQQPTVSWKPKHMSPVQVSKEKCGKDNNPSSSASQKERARGECLLTEYPGNTPLSSPCENEQQLNQQASSTHTPQMKDPSDICPIASCSNAPPSPSCGSGQQVEDMGKQGLTKPASQSGLALEELNPAAVPPSSCESGGYISETDKKAVFGPTSQPVSVVAMSLKPEDAPLSRGVMKPHRNYTSWRRKTPSVRNIAVTSAFSKEANENDPLASMHVEGAPKIVHYQQSLSLTCSPMEQGYRSPFFRKPNFLYDDNKRAAHHQHAPKHTGQIEMSKNSHARGLNHVESLDRSRSDSDVKPVRHGPLHSGRKFADSNKKGWVVKTEARCGDR